jgi:PAS domain S-box-containing protein
VENALSYPLRVLSSSLSGLSVYLRCRVCWQIALAVFLSIVAIEGAILIPSVRSFERDLLLRLEESSLNALAAVVEIHGSEATSADLVRFEAPLARATPIRGGVLLDVGGEPIAEFGERPNLNGELAPTSESRLGRLITGRSRIENGTRYDVRWPSAYTGLTGDVVARLDSSWIDPELVSFVVRIALLVLMISVFVSGGAMVVLGRSILTPMLQVRTAVVAACDDPAHADTYSPNYARRNEMGELVRALNRLLVRISQTHREELAMLHAMVNETSIAITACNESGTLIYANQAALSLCGCKSMMEMQGKGLPRFGLPDTDGKPVTLTELLAEDGYSGEATLYTGAGAPVPAYVNAGTLTNDSDQPLRYYATIADISEVREAQEGLRQRNLELATAERAKSKFLANMSHEIRTPLNAIIGFSELMVEELAGPNGDIRHRTYIEDIRKSGLHLLDIINDVLDMAKIESGTIHVQFSDVSITDVIDDALRMVSQQIDAKEIAVTVNIDKRVPAVRADELKLRQILLNLLSNAVKFTPAGGMITVRVSPSHCEKLGACLKIVVTDTGIGIAAEELETVLEPFSQGAAPGQIQRGGAGLGLALCKALTEAHEGTFAIDSTLHKGTSATLCLPIKQAIEQAA